MRPAVALLVLDRLEGQLARRHRVPFADSFAEATAPAAHTVNVLGEVEEVCADAADTRDCVESSALGCRVAHGDREGQGEDGGVVLGCAARLGDLDDAGDRALTVVGDAADDRLGVLLGKLALLDVVCAALGTQV